MKLIRRPDLDSHTRIHIVRLAWLYQGVYGKMTHIATSYQLSRTFLSQLLLMANLQLETLCSDAKLLFHKDYQHLDQRRLLGRFEGNCSLLRISAILQALEYQPNAVGYLRQCFQSAGQMLPSTLWMPSKKWVFDRSDAIFALHGPLVLTLDARRTTILNIELAADRSAETWRAPCDALAEHQFVRLGMASARGLGLVASDQAACDMALWVADYFHEVRDLFAVLPPGERQASAAMVQEHEAAHQCAHAKGEANLAKRLQPSDTAPHAWEQASALSDHLAMRLHLRREALYFGSPHGRLRPGANVRSALMLLVERIAERDCAAMTKTRKPLDTHIDDMVVPFKHVEAIATALRAVVPHDAGEFLVLAWHHAHCVYQAGSKHKASHHRTRDCWLACAAGLLGDAFDTLTALGFDQLDAIVRASSLVEMVHALIRPSLNSGTGQITQETLHLIMFDHHHRRSKSGKRPGKAPLERLSGKPGEAPWWELLRQQVNTAQGVTAPGTVPSRPPLHLVVNNDGGTDRQTIARGQAIVDSTGASENHRCQQGSEAAGSFPLY